VEYCLIASRAVLDFSARYSKDMLLSKYTIAGGMVFEVAQSAAGIRAPARFADEPLLLSGYLEHDELVRGKATVLEAPFEKGRIVMFGFNVHNRAQAHATFKLLFNALLY
jgi:hypothetical protein